MAQKYGKVYVLERQIADDGKEVAVPRLLENIRFSNLDHKWYDSEGNLSVLYKKYKGRPISVQFKLNLNDKDGKEVEFEANVNLVMKLGELPPQDFENCEKATKEMMETWKRLGMLSGEEYNDDGCSFLQDYNSAAFVAAIAPGSKISEMKSLYTCCDPWFILDECIDRIQLQKDMPFKVSNLYMNTVSDVLAGKTISKEVKTLENIPRQLSKLLIGVQAFHEVLAEKGKFGEHVIESYRDYHNAVALENSSEWMAKQGDSASLIFKALQKELRMNTIAAAPTVEMIMFDRDIRVDKKIRESFLFKSLLRTFTQHCLLINDLMSLKKEMAAGETSNTIIVLHLMEGLSLQNALRKITEEIDLVTKVVNETGELFLSLYGEYAEAAKLMEAIKGVMYGNVQWCIICRRYLPDVIFDCVVEL